MRHIAHLMIGHNFDKILCGIKQYIARYGSSGENRYFSAILYSDTDNGFEFSNAELIDSDENTFVAGLEDKDRVVLKSDYLIPAEKNKLYINEYFTRLFNRNISINDPGDSNAMYVCVYVPLYDKKAWGETLELLDAIESIPQRFCVDLFLLPYDLAVLFEENQTDLPEKIPLYRQTTKEQLHQVLEAKKEHPSLNNLVLMQNCNSNGLSLGLDIESFVRIASEYALLSVSHYDEMYSPAAQDPSRPIHALGLSVLSFDRYYFVQYLLHKAYAYILGREGIQQEEVDVNKVSNIADKILKNNVNVFSDFYSKHIEPMLNNNIDQETIITKVRPLWQEEIKRLTDECQSFIDFDASELSLPEKEATLAQLLGEDDQLLVGYMFNAKQLVIDDCSREVLDLFTKANNDILSMTPRLSNAIGVNGEELLEDAIEKEKIGNLHGYAVLSGTSKQYALSASTILDELKSIKVKMRESSNYIRQKTMELDNIEVQMQERVDSKKRLTANGFVFEGNTYQLQKTIAENPFEEDYVPIDDLPNNIDLRDCFTPVKNQGHQSSCSAFAAVSVFEYILKKNKQTNFNLSEQFVYYNARKVCGQQLEDSGASLYDVITSMAKDGVCFEKTCPFIENDCTMMPLDEAYSEASDKKVVKAMNVKISEKDIKSAIAQGYPVMISINLYDSFEPHFGFISRPTIEEIKSGNHGSHAMVVCGYSDQEKIFIVRNSWGTSFGVKGYCYIPYSYITDPEFINAAFIITEISDGTLSVKGISSKKTIAFDMNNSNVKAAILRNLIKEEELLLISLDKDLGLKDVEYNMLFQKLGNNTVRRNLCDGKILQLRTNQEHLLANKQQLEEQRRSDLKDFDSVTKRTKIWAGVSAAFVVLVYVLICIISKNPNDILFNDVSYFVYVVLGLSGIVFRFWCRSRIRKRNDLDNDYKTELEQTASEIAMSQREEVVTHLKMHVAGMIIDSLAKLFHDLHTKYSSMQSFLGNIKVWYKEETEMPEMMPLVRNPFLSLISNDCLDKYFQSKCDAITENLRLCSMFRNKYDVNENQIIKFKNQLKDTLIEILFNETEDFSVYNHVMGDIEYPYVNREYTDIDSLLRKMDQKSLPFVSKVATVVSTQEMNTYCKLLYMCADLNEERIRWTELCDNNFQYPPLLVRSESPYKLTIFQLMGLSLSELALLK